MIVRWIYRWRNIHVGYAEDAMKKVYGRNIPIWKKPTYNHLNSSLINFQVPIINNHGLPPQNFINKAKVHYYCFARQELVATPSNALKGS